MVNTKRNSAMYAGLFATAALLLAACTSTPSASEAATVAASPAPAATSAPSSAGKTSTHGVASGSMQVSADAPVVAKARPGYRARYRNGGTVYCRSETPTGSRMPVENCYTEAQLHQSDVDAQALKDDLSRARSSCAQPPCNQQ